MPTMSTARLAGCLTLLLAATGCPKSDPKPPPDPPCTADSECAADAGVPQVCLGGACLPAACGDHPCHAGQACEEGECRAEDCLGLGCEEGKGCAAGKCWERQCGGAACPPGDVCVGNRCVFTACAEKTCAANAACADGRCLPKACAGGTCAEGAACDGAACVALSCIGLTCPDGTACLLGRCLKTACEAPCAPGQACLDGTCVDLACHGLTCGAGQRCAQGLCSTCPAREATCSGGQDDDCDGKVDCADADCDGQACGAGKSCQAGTCAVEPCGDGKVEAPEACDDGNRDDGDGCSARCVVECGWTCDTQAPSLCTAEDFVDLTARFAGVFGAGSVRALAVGDDGLYAGGDAGRLARLDRSCAVTDLTPKISAFWGDAAVVAMAWDAAAQTLYLGGLNRGRFALYHPPGWTGTDARHAQADQAWDLAPKHALVTQPWAVDALVVDPVGKAVYLAATSADACGPSHLVRYRPDADACDVGLNTCANPCLEPPNACGIAALTLDQAGRTLWATGRGKIWTGFHKLDLTGAPFQKCASATLSNNWPRATVFDATGAALYVAGSVYDSPGGDFVRWEPATATTTKLTDKLVALFGAAAGDLNDLWAMALDPVNHVVYVGGRFGKLAQYRTPDNAKSPDKAALVSLGDTTWGAESVRGLAYDPAGFVWIAGDAGKVARLRARP